MTPVHGREQITLAYGVAHVAHYGQRDRDGRPHIDHVTRVVAGVQSRRTEPEAAHGRSYLTFRHLSGVASETVAAAWLHDVVEDSPITPEYLARIGFRPVVIEAVRMLTRPEEPSYHDYVAGIAEADTIGRAGEIARLIKLADLEDNLHRSINEGNNKAIRRYDRAAVYLRAAMLANGEQL